MTRPCGLSQSQIPFLILRVLFLLSPFLNRPVNCDYKRNNIDHSEDPYQCVRHANSRSRQRYYCCYEAHNRADQPNLIIGHNSFTLSFHKPEIIRIQATRNKRIDSQSGRICRKRSNTIQPAPSPIPILHRFLPSIA